MSSYSPVPTCGSKRRTVRGPVRSGLPPPDARGDGRSAPSPAAVRAAPVPRPGLRQLRIAHQPQIEGAFIQRHNLLAGIGFPGLDMHVRVAPAKGGQRIGNRLDERCGGGKADV